MDVTDMSVKTCKRCDCTRNAPTRQYGTTNFVGDYCNVCSEAFHCPGTGCKNMMRWADNPKKCECGQRFCDTCYESDPKLTRTECCGRVYCDSEWRQGDCTADQCGWCGKCTDCITQALNKESSRPKIWHFKECATFDCDAEICETCCKTVFNKDLRYCKKCLHENGKIQILKVSKDFKPKAPIVKGLANDYKATSAKFDATK